jgi:hypothetical protein
MISFFYTFIYELIHIFKKNYKKYSLYNINKLFLKDYYRKL